MYCSREKPLIRLDRSRLKLLLLCGWLAIGPAPSCRQSATLPASASISAYITEAPAMPIARAGHAGGLVDGRLLVAGGSHWSDDRSTKKWLNDSVVFVAGQWKAGPALPQPTSDAYYAYDSTGLYIAGGTDGTDGTNQSQQVYRLSETNPQASWQPLAPLPSPMSDGCGAIVDSKFYVCCGYIGKTLSRQLWSLDLNDPDAHWRRRQALPGPARVYPALVACGGQLYLLGGLIMVPDHPGFTVLRDTYSYDPPSDQWRRLADLPFTGYAWSAAAVDEQSVLLTARAFENSRIDSDIWIVNVDDMVPTPIGQTVIQSCCAPLVKVNRNTWYLVGGEPDATHNRTARVTAIRLDPTSQP